MRDRRRLGVGDGDGGTSSSTLLLRAISGPPKDGGDRQIGAASMGGKREAAELDSIIVRRRGTPGESRSLGDARSSKLVLEVGVRGSGERTL